MTERETLMGHMSADQMEDYIRGRMSGQARGLAEMHLENCDHCIQLFMTVESRCSGEVPLPDMKLLEQRVIAQLSERPTPPRRSYWLQRSAVQYAIAASITLLLLGSGTFTSFAEKLARMEWDAMVSQQQQAQVPPAPQRTEPESWSDQWVDKTGFWLDGLKAARFNSDSLQ